MPELRPVTKDNWHALIKLKVRDDQTHFVESNVYSILESHYGYDSATDGHWDLTPYGIYDGAQPVVFLMLGYNFTHPQNQGFIVRLMVDANFQGKGYGKFAMEKTIEIFRAADRIKTAAVSYEPGNDVARQLYAKYGFVETGEIADGETVAALKLRD